jgi:hypothetical protein
MNKNPFSPVTVIQWKSSSEKETFIFTDDSMKSEQKGILINEIIYKDDTIEMALNKIAAFISKKDNVSFYAWKNNPILFSIENKKWKGYHPNPFKSSDHSSKQLDEPITYEYNTSDLFNYSYINIVFKEDLPKLLQTNKYYISELKRQPFKFYRKQNELLTTLKNTQNVVNILPEYYNHVNFQASVQNIILSELFDNMHTSKTIDMIQWVDDTSRILYKLSKHNRLRKEHLENFTNTLRIDKINVINLYSIFNKKSYCKISIQHNGNITYSYILQQREFIKWQDIDENQQKINNILQNFMKTKISSKVVSLDTRVKMDVHNSVFKQLVKKLTENVFNLVKNDLANQTIVCVYKRSSNFIQNTDIYDHIQSRIELGISITDIKQELENLGITSGFEQMIEGVMENMSKENEMIKNNNTIIKNNGTIVIIKPYSTGYDIAITNCPNKKELHYLNYWLSKIISTTIDKKAKVPVYVKPDSPKAESPQSVASSVSRSSYSSDSIDYDNIDSWMGGVPPKKKTNQNKYLINMLRNADKELFEENYARDKCQANKQPIVLSAEMKENLEKTDQMHFDNIIKYGSRDDIQNFYACPRLWCPESKVPLSPDVADAKCPLDNEEPMQMFWDNDKDKKRYVKLIKKNEKGLYAPCCVKREPIAVDENNPSNKKEDATENDNYIMNQVTPLPDGRYGSIPEYLHKIIFYKKNVKPEACKTTLNKSHYCFLRKGIMKSSSDSYITSLSEILGSKNKKELVRKIIKEIDLLTFISLDDGNICKQFMNIIPLIPNDHSKLQKEYESFKKNKLHNLNGDSTRLFNIYVAYKKYIEYIASNDFTIEKKPKYLYTLIHILYKINILICEKINEEIYFHCPSQVDFDLNPDVGIIIKEGRYYEPLEFKMRNTDGIKIFKLNEYPMLKDIVSKCKQQSDNLYKKIYTANNWIMSASLNNAKRFYTKTVFINDDLTIDKLLSNGGVLYKFDKIGISVLPKLLKDFNLKSKNVEFFSESVGKSIGECSGDEEENNSDNTLTTLNIDDCNKVSKKMKEFNISVIVGINKGIKNKILHNKLVLTNDMMKISDSDTILSQKSFNKTLYNTAKEFQKESRELYKLRRMVVKTIIKKYTDKQLADLNNLDRKSKIQKLLQHFKNMKNRQNSIQIILEELPTDSHKHLKKWLSHHTVFAKYDLHDIGIKDDKEFVFSQTALFQNGDFSIPDILLKYHYALPNIRNSEINNVENMNISEDIGVDSQLSLNMNATNDINVGNLEDLFTGNMKDLPAKWRTHKKKIWRTMQYEESKYSRETIKTLVEWLSIKLDISNIDYDDIVDVVKPRYFNILHDKNAMIHMWHDKSYFNEWLIAMNKNYKTPQILWEAYEKLSKANRETYITDILNKNVLYPNDLYLEAIAKILNINILLIHRAPYRSSDSSEASGSNEDLSSSSSVFYAYSNVKSKPLIVLYKLDAKDKPVTGYYLVYNKDMPNKFYLKYTDAPEDIISLVELKQTQN